MNCWYWAISPFPTVFSLRFENFLPFSSNLKLLSETLSVRKSLKFVVWKSVKAVANCRVCLSESGGHLWIRWKYWLQTFYPVTKMFSKPITYWRAKHYSILALSVFTTWSWLTAILKEKTFRNMEWEEVNSGNQHFLLFPHFRNVYFVFWKCFQFGEVQHFVVFIKS